MSEIDIIAIISPAPGKTARVVELLNEVAVYAKENEPGTLKYQITQEADKKSGAEEVIMIETYKDKAALGAHGSSDVFKSLQQKLKEEGLVIAPPQLKFIKHSGGYASRL